MTQSFCIYCNRFVDTFKTVKDSGTMAKPTSVIVDTGKCTICMNTTEQRDLPEVSNIV